MFQSNPYEQYKENSVFTASPEELTLMLYNALVKNVLKAQNAVQNKDIEKSHNSILKAQDIIYEFICTLDMKYEVSKGLSVMYDYMVRRLQEANIKKDPEILEEVLGYAKELRDTWTQAMKIAKKQNAANGVSSNEEMRIAK